MADSTADIGQHLRELLDDVKNGDWPGVLHCVSDLTTDVSEIAEGFSNNPQPAPQQLQAAAPDPTCNQIRAACGEQRQKVNAAKAAGGHPGSQQPHQPVGFSFNPQMIAQVIQIVETVIALVEQFRGGGTQPQAA